jgi:hypothetical protein
MIPSKELIQKLIDEALTKHANNNWFDRLVDSHVSRGLYRAQYEVDYGKMSSSDFDPLPFKAMQKSKDYSYAIEYYQRVFQKMPYIFFGVDVADKRVYTIFQKVYNHETKDGLNAKNFPSNLYTDPKDVIDQLIAAYPKAEEHIMGEYKELLKEQEEYPNYEGEIIKGKHTLDLTDYGSTKLWI